MSCPQAGVFANRGGGSTPGRRSAAGSPNQRPSRAVGVACSSPDCPALPAVRAEFMTAAVSDAPFVFSPGMNVGGAGGSAAGPPRGRAAPADQTRQELSAIVHEIARQVGSNRPLGGYGTLLVHRTMQALAAESVVLWRHPTPEPSSTNAESVAPPDVPVDPESIEAWRGCGPMVDGCSRGPDSALHRELVADVIAHGQPVLIPAGRRGEPSSEIEPGSVADREDASVESQSSMSHRDRRRDPQNVSPWPVAIVPIPLPHPLDYGYALAAFVENEGSAATMRGYLRFVAQMADLAAQFLAIDFLKRLNHRQRHSAFFADVAGRWGDETSAGDVCESLVDAIAERLDVRRASWWRMDGNRFRPRGCSHVTEVDTEGPWSVETARWLAKLTLDPGSKRCVRVRGDDGGVVPLAVLVASQGREILVIELDDAPEHLFDSDRWHETGWAESDEDSPLPGPVADSTFIPSPKPGRDRGDEPIFVAESAATAVLSDAVLKPVVEFFDRAIDAAQLRQRIETMPLAKWLHRTNAEDRTRPILVAGCLGLIVLMMSMLPMPNNVSAAASLWPEQLQTATCPTDCIVEKVHVGHGQSVQAGELLLSLEDPELDNEELRLLGELDVMVEQSQTLSNRLVDPTIDREERPHLEDEQLVLKQRMKTLRGQLDWIERRRSELMIHADVDGVVDAWQIRTRMDGRPMRRGEMLLRVLPTHTPWRVIVQVPRRKMMSIHDASLRGRLSGELTLDGMPDRHFAIALDEVGPVAGGTAAGDGGASQWVKFSVDLATLGGSRSSLRTQQPGRVLIRCGNVPLGRWMWGDLWDATSDLGKLYFGRFFTGATAG